MTPKLLLALALMPYLALSAWDGWLHEKARRVPRAEQALHGLLFVSCAAFLYGLFGERPAWVVPGLVVFALAACCDEFGFHGALERRERRLHHAAYACFAGFVGVALAQGRIALPWT